MTTRLERGWRHEAGLRGWEPPAGDLIAVGRPSRRWFLRAGMSGVAGLSAAQLLRLRAEAAAPAARAPKSVILFWLSGGPSHLDMWDPKPDAP